MKVGRYKEVLNTLWLIIPFLLLVILISKSLYYKAHYCKEIQYETTCEECIEWVDKDNGRYGKYRRTWQECVEYRKYKCYSTYDSCGDTKIK
jgi:hypothetical protein